MTTNTPAIETAIAERPATKERRTIERTYDLIGLEHLDARRELVHPRLRITVMHDAERKRYLMLVARETVGPIFVRSVIDFGASMPPEVKALRFAEPAARYSAQAMSTLFDEYVRDHVEPNLQVLLDWAAGADEGE